MAKLKKKEGWSEETRVIEEKRAGQGDVVRSKERQMKPFQRRLSACLANRLPSIFTDDLTGLFKHAINHVFLIIVESPQTSRPLDLFHQPSPVTL